MRIAIVHSFYVSATPSGENLAVLREVNALSEAGHEVKLIARNTDDLASSRLYPLTSAVRVATGRGGDPTDEIRAFNPDITHIHNLFPNIGTSWLDRWEGPVVVTLHNFRPLCANGILFRDGKTCTECPDGSPASALKHACYRGSKVATLPLAAANRGGIKSNRLLQRADRVIVLSDRAQSIYRKYGLPSEKMTVIANGLAFERVHETSTLRSDHWVGVGRLTPEKGFAELASIWPDDRALDIIGTGPQAESITELARANVSLNEPVPNGELLARLPRFAGLVLPSKCFEGLPTVVLEALGSGLPVIAHSGNSAADFLSREEPSWVYDGSKGSLEKALSAISEQGADARARARSLFDAEFSLENWVARLEGLFRTLV